MGVVECVGEDGVEEGELGESQEWMVESVGGGWRWEVWRERLAGVVI